MNFPRGTLVGTRAPEFPAGLTWLNGEPLTLQGLQLAGRLTLIDFWTYSCINCINTLPYLNQWHETYSDKGLSIIGVHTPEFEFEKEEANVHKAILEFGIKYPIVLDNTNLIWGAYANRVWPRKILIAPDNKIVYDHAGEGDYLETENKISELLKLELKPAPQIPEGTNSVCYRATPEVYLGYKRGYVSNFEGFFHDQSHNYDYNGEHELDMWYLQGHWIAGPEGVEYVGEPGKGQLIIQCAAFSINIVAGVAPGASPVMVKYSVDSEEKSFEVGAQKMYPLFKSQDFKEHTVKLMPQGKGLKFYALTFGGCD